MFKKLLLITALIFPTIASAEERADWFYDKQISTNLKVQGVKYINSTRLGACFLSRTYDDGSTIEISAGLEKGDYLWINVVNRKWKSDQKLIDLSRNPNAPDLKFRISLLNASGGVFQGNDFSYLLFKAGSNGQHVRAYTEISKNLFSIISKNNIASIKFVFDGDVLDPVVIGLDNIGKKIEDEIIACMKIAKSKNYLNYKKEEEKKPSTGNSNKGMGI